MNPLRLVARPLRRVVRIVRTARRTVERLPDALEAVLILPTLSRQLEAVGFSTATLPEMHAEIARVRGDTARLVQIDETLVRMAVLLDAVEGNTRAVQELTEVLVPLRGAAMRVGRLSDGLGRRRRVEVGAVAGVDGRSPGRT